MELPPSPDILLLAPPMPPIGGLDPGIEG